MFCISGWRRDRACGEQRRQADGVHGAAVQQAQQRAGYLLLPGLMRPRQQHPTRRIRGRPQETAARVAAFAVGILAFLVAADRRRRGTDGVCTFVVRSSDRTRGSQPAQTGRLAWEQKTSQAGTAVGERPGRQYKQSLLRSSTTIAPAL